MIEPGLRMVFLIVAVILALLAAPVPGTTSPPAVYTRVNLLSLAVAALAAAFLFP